MKKKECIYLITFVAIIFASINVFAYECTGVFSDELISALNNYVYKPIKIATPVLLIVLTSIDFAKLVFTGNKEGLDKAKKNFTKRAIAALVIFFAPDIINLIVDIVQERSISSCLSQFK